MKDRLTATLQSTPPSMRALAYAGIAFLVGAITQVIQGLASAGAMSDWHAYLLSLIVAAVAGGLSAALPYLLTMLPAPPAPPTPPSAGPGV